MKSILLTSTALVAFAGAAAAEVSFGADAALGYNDDIEGGFYWDANVAVTLSQELDNGLTVEATFDFDVADNNLGQDLASGGYVVTVSSDLATLKFGDTDPAADTHWDDVDGMAFAGFADADNFADDLGSDAILYGEASMAGVTGALSYGVTAGGDLDGMQVAVVGTFGPATVVAAYQEDTTAFNEVFGITASASVAGADLKVSYGDDGAETSTAVGVSYPVGPVTVGAYYAMNDVADDAYGVSADYSNGPVTANVFFDTTEADGTNEFGVEGSYDVGNGIMAYAGFINTEATDSSAYYVAGTYDLGGGASVLVSYAEDEANAANDEIGDPEYMHGTTVEVSFEF